MFGPVMFCVRVAHCRTLAFCMDISNTTRIKMLFNAQFQAGSCNERSRQACRTMAMKKWLCYAKIASYNYNIQRTKNCFGWKIVYNVKH